MGLSLHYVFLLLSYRECGKWERYKKKYKYLPTCTQIDHIHQRRSGAVYRSLLTDPKGHMSKECQKWHAYKGRGQTPLVKRLSKITDRSKLTVNLHEANVRAGVEGHECQVGQLFVYWQRFNWWEILETAFGEAFFGSLQKRERKKREN